ncbi:MAG: N-acetylneuraminate synthase family protein [Spirochaetales bacterium]
MPRPIIIAEVGTSHGGDLGRAKELVASAKEAGADAVKFQIVYAKEILPPNCGEVELPGGRVPLFERFRSLERPLEFYAAIKEESEARGLCFVCTPFGLQSARNLRDIGTRIFKIASPELTFYPLLEEVSSYGAPLLLSTGVSTLGDIEQALTVVQNITRTALKRDEAFKAPPLQKENISRKPSSEKKWAALFRKSTVSPVGSSSEKGKPSYHRFFSLTLLHCITAYPAPEEEYNLSLLPNLRAIFGVPVGISDHSLDPVLVPVLSVLEGAVVIEKHITLDRKAKGLDDPIALEPKAFTLMVQEVRAAYTEIRAGRRSQVVEALEAHYGKKRVLACLGTGVKRLAPSEAPNYFTTNRSLHALVDLEPGDRLSEENCALLRTEKNLKPGLAPEFYKQVLGKRVTQKVPAGEGIRFEHLLSS